MSEYHIKSIVTAIIYAAFILRGQIDSEDDTVGEVTDRILAFAAGDKPRV